jgi:hypothetical protein
VIEKAGYGIVRVAGIEWEDRKNVDGWLSRAGMYCDDKENSLCIRLIDYPVGSTEPRHVHGGTHATTVLKHRAIVDGLTLLPLDVVLGPSNEPHGPLHYPDGCQLLSAFQGSYFHSEVERLSGKKEYRLVQQAQLPWMPGPENGAELKTLIDHGCGRLLLQVLRYAPGSALEAASYPKLHSALVVEGAAAINGEVLGAWDFVRVLDGAGAGPIRFPRGATLLAITMR